MPDELMTVATELVERLLALAAQDAELHSQLRRLAQAFLAASDERPPQPASDQSANAPIATQVQDRLDQLEAAFSHHDAAESEESTAPRPPLPKLTLGQAVQHETEPPVYASPKPLADLSAIEARCRLKAEGARWAAARRRLLAEGASYDTEIAPRDREIIARAKELPNCFLWMCNSSGPSPSNLALYEEVAGCFEAIAETLALLKQIQAETDSEQIDFEAALDLLAEGQSALRVAVVAIDGSPDSDQNEVFHWLRATAAEQQILIRNHMRLDNPADPAEWPDILNRVEEILARLQEAKRGRSERKRLLGKVRHKTSLIANDPARAASEWDLLIGAVGELIAGGLQPSNRELRELLLPAIELLPERESFPRDFERVLLEIDRFLATCPPPETPAIVRPSPEVTAVANLLSGKSLVLIGGDKRQGAYLALKAAFDLKDLIWIETRAHESFASFGPYVARPDVAAVLLAIRWSSHSYGEVKTFCDEYGKPLVRLPAGYNPNQVAAQILAQASDRL
jgi:hypothetical protein